MNSFLKIKILICYYGEIPWYFRYFLHSCKFNPTVDFFIFSDMNYSDKLPANVTIIHKSLTDIKKLASAKLGFPVTIDFPYKLCDFKPAYGLIFSEYIEGYDFWGQSDIDIIYGDIRKFMTNELLTKYDFVSVRHDYTSGCFALYRNNKLMNNFFKRSKDYKRVFESSRHLCFDECNFVQDLLTEGESIFDLKTEIESLTHVIKCAEQNNEIRAHFDFLLMEGIPGSIRFDNGRIIYKNKIESILYHLYWFKRGYTTKNTQRPIPNLYHISPSRIYF